MLLSTKESFEFAEFFFGVLDVFARGLRVIALNSTIGGLQIRVQTTRRSGYILAQTESAGGLLLTEIVQAGFYGVSARV
jgi:hypothetical protein